MSLPPVSVRPACGVGFFSPGTTICLSPYPDMFPMSFLILALHDPSLYLAATPGMIASGSLPKAVAHPSRQFDQATRRTIQPCNPRRWRFLPTQGKRMLIQPSPVGPEKRNRPTYGSPLSLLEMQLTPWKIRMLAGHPPGRPKSYFWHTNPFPGKFQKDFENMPLHDSSG